MPPSDREQIFSDLREEYQGAVLREGAVPGDPFALFHAWFDQAVEAEIPLANAMTLATVDPDARPSARTVLLKSVDTGFVFFTHYQSRKGLALEANPLAALLFWWQSLSRQVRIEGTVERIEPELSDRYFASRPRESNLSAMASPQSQVVPDRAWLEARVAEVRDACRDQPLERPAEWGGYRVVPRQFEFWQGQPDRLHDRLCYTRSATDDWLIQRLAP